jgi:hypothetical protein
MVRVLKSINFSYVAAEDRILAVINPGGPEAWSCWLTRRLVLALLDRTSEFLASTSPLVQQVPAEVRGELATFEREAAMASTARAMSTTPAEVLKTSESAAELAGGLKISSQANGFRVELQGEKELGAAGLFTRAELQRFLQMLQAEAAKAGWFAIPDKLSAGTSSEAAGAKPVRH